MAARLGPIALPRSLPAGLPGGLPAGLPGLPVAALLAQVLRVGSALHGEHGSDPPHRHLREGPMTDYRIDDLAQAAGMTTRNVRAYQGLGLLPPPRREGRVAWYSDVHLARLRLLGNLLEKGYTSAQIAELIGAWEQGRDLSDVLGIEEALNTPWSDEVPTYVTRAEAEAHFTDDSGSRLDRAVELGLVTLEGDRALLRRPQLVHALGEMRQYGFDVDTILDVHERLVPLLDQVADLLVGTALDGLTQHLGTAWVPDNETLGELGPALQRMRQLSMQNVQQTLAGSMERSIERVLQDFFAQIPTGQATGRTASDPGA